MTVSHLRYAAKIAACIVHHGHNQMHAPRLIVKYILFLILRIGIALRVVSILVDAVYELSVSASSESPSLTFV